jgi:hypothetical protein
MSESVGTCPLCGNTALLEYDYAGAATLHPADLRLTDVSCTNNRCKNYVLADRVRAARGHGGRQL